MKNISKLLILVAFFVGCKSNLKDDLISKVDQECKTKKTGCRIRIKDITKFTWDQMFVFGAWTLSDSIKNAIKLPYDNDDVPDDNVRILFLYKKKICYQEDIEQTDAFKSTLIFPNFIDSLNRAEINYFSPSNAIFLIDRGKNENSCKQCFFYSLEPAVRNF